ncbi:MAG: hypothetical protein HEEMFOPI_01714 [Holosporales bacterium]
MSQYIKLTMFAVLLSSFVIAAENTPKKRMTLDDESRETTAAIEQARVDTQRIKEKTKDRQKLFDDAKVAKDQNFDEFSTGLNQMQENFQKGHDAIHEKDIAAKQALFKDQRDDMESDTAEGRKSIRDQEEAERKSIFENFQEVKDKKLNTKKAELSEEQIKDCNENLTGLILYYSILPQFSFDIASRESQRNKYPKIWGSRITGGEEYQQLREFDRDDLLVQALLISRNLNYLVKDLYKNTNFNFDIFFDFMETHITKISNLLNWDGNYLVDYTVEGNIFRDSRYVFNNRIIRLMAAFMSMPSEKYQEEMNNLLKYQKEELNNKLNELEDKYIKIKPKRIPQGVQYQLQRTRQEFR